MTVKLTHIAVLMGGWSAEREVSLVSGGAVKNALIAEGYKVTTIDVNRDFPKEIQQIKPDIVFNALHGRWGEDGCVQGVLELLKIPYTHSGVLASAIAMNKPLANRIFTQAGIVCPKNLIINRKNLTISKTMKPPFVVKPINEGSSVGVIVVIDEDDLAPLKTNEWKWGNQVLVENYIPGRDIQVVVMGDKAIGAIEIQPIGRFYDYESKYTAGKAQHIVPAPIHSDAYQEALELATLAHMSIGCRGVTRTDLRYDDSEGEPGKLYVLEINTQPGMTPLSLVPEVAANYGMGFNDLVCWMVKEARCDN